MDTALSLSPEEMRRLGYRVTDMIIDHFTSLPEKNVLNIASPADLRRQLDQSLPDAPMNIESVLELVTGQVLKHISHGDHPRFFAFIPGPSNFVGVMADALAAGFNVCASNWLEASGPAEIERISIRWLTELCGYPEGAGGTFLSGGSMANLTAIAVARQHIIGKPDPASLVYYADQAHMSIFRGLRVLGFASEQLRPLPTDAQFRMDSRALSKQLAIDIGAGLRPFCVIATAGTTNTGAVDPLAGISATCKEHGMWLHVDGAYGAGAILSQRGRDALAGIELADSISIDPHKWLFQPIESGCLLVRNINTLRRAFDESPEYLSDVDAVDDEINFYQHTIQLTRQTRALKLWMSLKVFGADAFRAAIEKGFANAEWLEDEIRRMKNWAVVSPASMGIICFRFAPGELPATGQDEINQAIADRLSDSGTAFIGTTVLRGQKALRMCPINPRTTTVDLRETLQRLGDIASELLIQWLA